VLTFQRCPTKLSTALAMPKTTIICLNKTMFFLTLPWQGWVKPNARLSGKSSFTIIKSHTSLLPHWDGQSIPACLDLRRKLRAERISLLCRSLKRRLVSPAILAVTQQNYRRSLPGGKWEGTADLGLVHEGWNDKSANTKWAPSASKIEVWVREARRWLRDLGMKSGGHAEIIVVTHGGYLHYFTEDWTWHIKSVGKLNRFALEICFMFPHTHLDFCSRPLLTLLQRYWLGQYKIQIVHFPIWNRQGCQCCRDGREQNPTAALGEAFNWGWERELKAMAG
jgi:hypothetical protein